MNVLNFTAYELKLVEIVQKLTKFELLNKFFYYISFLGEAYLFMVVAIILYLLVDKKWGYKFIVAFLTSSVLVGALKVAFRRVRPFNDSLVVKSIGPKTPGHSMPSGHSNSASVISTGILKGTSNKFVRFLFILNIILIPFSRIYLGQHYLTDVLAGIALGALVVFIVFKVFDKTEKEDLVGLIIVPFALGGMYLLHKLGRYNKDMFRAAGAAVAFAIGYLFEKRVIKFVPNDSRKWVQFIKLIVGLGGTAALYIGLDKLPFINEFEGLSTAMEYVWQAAKYAIIAIWITVLAPAIFKLIFRTKSEKMVQSLVEKKPERIRVKLPYQEA